MLTDFAKGEEDVKKFKEDLARKNEIAAVHLEGVKKFITSKKALVS